MESLPPYLNNRSLFSDYYLTELVKDDPFWGESVRESEEVRRKIEEIYSGVPHPEGLNEAETEHRLIRPVLDALEHIYALQPSVGSPEGVRRPDFAFFPDADKRDKTETQHKHGRASFRGEAQGGSGAGGGGETGSWELEAECRRVQINFEGLRARDIKLFCAYVEACI